MWIFSFKKSPQEILEDKYLELIDTNGIDKLHKNPPWFPYMDKAYYSGVINGVKWVRILCYQQEHEEWQYDSYGWGTKTSYTYHVWIGKIESSSSFAEKIWRRMNALYTEQQQARKQEQERLKKEKEEADTLAKDKIFIEEYNRLCSTTWEFNKHFKLLDEIESLGKEQIKLLEKWEENKNLVYKKREQFYSLSQ